MRIDAEGIDYRELNEQVRDAVADDLLVGGPLTSVRLLMARFQQRRELPPAEHLRLGPKLDRHLTATIQVSDDEVWGFFLDRGRSYEVAYVSLPAEQFLAEVPTTTDAERKAWYDEHKDRDPDESEDGVGYFLPERGRLPYFVARVEDFKKTVTVTEKELREHYDKNKPRYRITTRPTTEPASRPGTQPATQPVTQPMTRAATHPGTQPAAAPATAPATQPASRPATAPATQPASRPTTTRALEYRPFEEVREDIRDELAGQRAGWAAYQAVCKAGDKRLDLEDEPPDKRDYKALAERYQLTYVPSKGSVTARQAMEIEGLKDAGQAIPDEGLKSIRMGRPVAQVFFGRDTYPNAELVDFKGNAYHVWRTDWQKERALSYEQAREQVQRDLKAYRAYERAGARAGDLLEQLRQLPAATEAPLDELARKHPGLTVKTGKAFSLGSAEFAPRRAAPEATEDERESVRQGVFARLIRREDPQPGQAAVVGDPIARVQYLIRIAKRTDPDLAGFRRANAVYRLWALEQKRKDLLKAWGEAVNKRADVQPAKEQKEQEQPGDEPPVE